MKNKTTNIYVVIISIILLISTILIDGINQYYKYIQLIAYGIVISYFIVRIIKKEPIKIIRNWLDIFIIILVISTTIPVITNEYISLYGSVQTILSYTYALGIYLLIREITGQNLIIKRIINNILIISALILFIIGMDGITFNFSSEILKFFHIGEYTNGEDRLISLFGYSNVFAVYIASLMFLNISESVKAKNKFIKAIYNTITCIYIIGIILTYSKGIFLILPISLLAYIICIKDYKIEICINLFISCVIAILYIMVFEKLHNTELYSLIWILLGITTIMSYIINLLAEEMKKYIENIKLKKVLLCITIVFMLAIIYVIIGINIYDVYVVFSPDKPSSYEAKILNNIKGNEQYLIEFDIKAEAPKKYNEMYTIKIIERNHKNQEVNNQSIKFGSYEGKKTIELKTKMETTEIKIEFLSDFKYIERNLIIKKLTVNNEEIPLEYKYLPTKLVNKIKDININYKTAIERFEIAKDALQLSKDNIFTGIGGGAWKYKYGEVQDYYYVANSIHSYPAKIILEFGLLGFIAYVGIGISIIYILVKNKKTENISIIFSVIVLLSHGIIDIDMEYTHILLMFFGICGIISGMECSNKKFGIKLNPILNIIIILIFIVSICLILNSKIYNKFVNISELIEQQNGLSSISQEYKEISNKIAKEYEKLINTEKYNYLNRYNQIIDYYLDSNNENIEEILELYYEKVQNYKNENKYNIEHIKQKIEVSYSIIKEIEEKENEQYEPIKRKFVDIILNEYDVTLEEINRCIQTQHIKDKSVLLRMENIYQEISEIFKI